MGKGADSVFVRVLARERQRIGELERSLDELAAELERLQGELAAARTAQPTKAGSSAPSSVVPSPVVPMPPESPTAGGEAAALRAELAAAKDAN